MKKTWKEIHVSKCIKVGNKCKWLKPFMLICIFLFISLDRIGKRFMCNRKRLVGIGITFVIFMVSNSFSTPAFVQSASLDIDMQEKQNDSFANIQMETSDDYLYLEEEEISDEEENDKYSVDEILQSSDSEEFLTIDTTETQNKNFSKDDWNLILVNKQHPIPEGYSFELGTIAEDMKCDARILPELFTMLKDAKKDGVYLVICSPYRDIELQNVLFNRKIKLYMGRGYSYMEAYKKASQIVTVPGASEHQVGLALDIISSTYQSLDAGFGDTKAGKWLKEHSHEYGFILRYPQGKEAITGIDYEPWHFRYVGKEAATIIMEEEITLEEFVESISE